MEVRNPPVVLSGPPLGEQPGRRSPDCEGGPARASSVLASQACPGPGAAVSSERGPLVSADSLSAVAVETVMMLVGAVLLGFLAGLFAFKVKSRWCPRCGASTDAVPPEGRR
ncbi:hypothetical protein GCM10011608_53630 [Micromonospora sonchi]|uniref:Uncharacterized protein n=1 Tax=Micromonospora sonchi TaxID=1763543 RepID=A0A917X3P6_9ACTN|nr:hypothetical protein GCM10011608_53630 [Micromonospora sonchi]